MEKNWWHDSQVAEWFKDQHFARPYVEMMRVFYNSLPLQPKGTWLDIGCGSGETSKLLWGKKTLYYRFHN